MMSEFDEISMSSLRARVVWAFRFKEKTDNSRAVIRGMFFTPDFYLKVKKIRLKASVNSVDISITIN